MMQIVCFAHRSSRRMKMHILSSVLMISLLSWPVFCNKRNVTSRLLCPGPGCKNVTNIAYTQAVGHNDTLHYLFSTVGLPTLLVARTPLTAKLNFNIATFLSKNASESVSFTETPDTVYAMTFPTLIEYNDSMDEADFYKTGNTTSWTMHSLSDIVWDDATVTSNLTANIINMTVSRSQPQLDLGTSNGSFSIQFEVVGDTVRSDVLPHLQFNANTSQLNILLQGLEPAYNNSRYGLELVMITQSSTDNMYNLTTHSNLDDEHSPGNFKSVAWTTTGVDQTHGVFAQWKPICYRQSDYNTRTESLVREYGLHAQDTSHLNGMKPTLLQAYFTDLSRDVVIHAVNVSFGLPKDKFYNDTHYNGWTLSVGLGAPPADSLSITIIIIISAGLGLPAVMLIVGGVGICIKKRRSAVSKLYVDINSPQYSRIE